MKTRVIHIRRWSIVFIFSFDTHDEGTVYDSLLWADAPDSIHSKVSDLISAGYLNNGFCYSNTEIRRSVVGIGKTSSGPEFLNTAVHEITHIAQHIAEEDGIDPYSEEFAYLVGDITHEISDIVCEMSCPHCRGE